MKIIINKEILLESSEAYMSTIKGFRIITEREGKNRVMFSLVQSIEDPRLYKISRFSVQRDGVDEAFVVEELCLGSLENCFQTLLNHFVK